jgi:hypothetical protein
MSMRDLATFCSLPQSLSSEVYDFCFMRYIFSVDIKLKILLRIFIIKILSSVKSFLHLYNWSYEFVLYSLSVLANINSLHMQNHLVTMDSIPTSHVDEPEFIAEFGTLIFFLVYSNSIHQ